VVEVVGVAGASFLLVMGSLWLGACRK